MNQNTKRSYKYRDPKARLNAALETLELFTLQNSSEPIPYIHHKNKKENGLSKIIGLARDCVSAAFSQKVREKNESERNKVEDDVLNALDDVKRFHPIISNKQSEEAKILADRALETIRGYNSVFEKGVEKNSHWHNRLLKFLIQRSRLSFAKTRSVKLPQSINKGFHPIEKKFHPTSKIFSIYHKQQVPTPLTEREADVFRMKAISLIKNHPGLFSSITDTLCTIRETPIYSASASNESEKQVISPSIITLEQTLTPFPGETVILRGSFMHDPKAITPTTPLPDSFELTTESVQTGFPYPSQHNGWGLADILIPPYPLRPEYFESLTRLLEKKEAIANAFLNKTLLLEKSRKIWQRKIDLSKENKDLFIELHKVLAQAVIKYAPRKEVPKDSAKILSNFFSWLQTQESPLTALAMINRNINVLFIEEPHFTLLDAWLNQTSEGLFHDDPKKRFNTAKRIILGQIKLGYEKAEAMGEALPVEAYIRLFGNILGASSANIFLQYFSETLECAPPQLSDFEKKLQTAALMQQEGFFIELETDFSEYSFSRLKETLMKDISLFQKNMDLHPLCRQLEKYYTSRFVDSR